MTHQAVLPLGKPNMQGPDHLLSVQPKRMRQILCGSWGAARAGVVACCNLATNMSRRYRRDARLLTFAAVRAVLCWAVPLQRKDCKDWVALYSTSTWQLQTRTQVMSRLYR